jgi:hypothetical protein
LAFTWLLGLLLVHACGYALRSALTQISGGRDRKPCSGDLWLGLGALVAYLELWNLVAPVTAKALIAPCVVAGAGAAVAYCRRARPRPPRRPSRRHVVAGAAGGLLVLWLANQALGEPTNYDSGLYHFAAVEYASRFAAIPGLANLYERLGAADSHLLLVALAGTAPWRHAGFHVVNGLLTMMLLANASWMIADRRTPPISSRLSLLAASVTIFVVALDPGSRLSSPSLDFPAYVLVVAGTLHLCVFVERSPRSTSAALAATAAFATAAASRPQFVPATIVAGVVVATVAQNRMRLTIATALVPVAVLAGCAARQAVLSGYPLFPVRLGALPVDWRVPGTVVARANAWIRSWARTPGKPPAEVLGSWSWLPGWLGRTVVDPDVFVPLVLTILAAVRLRGCRQDARLVLLTLAPSLVTLVLWFVAAPDPRFVWGPIWLVPLVLLTARPVDHRVAVALGGLIVAALIFSGAWRPITERRDGPSARRARPLRRFAASGPIAVSSSTSLPSATSAGVRFSARRRHRKRSACVDTTSPPALRWEERRRPEPRKAPPPAWLSLSSAAIRRRAAPDRGALSTAVSPGRGRLVGARPGVRGRSTSSAARRGSPRRGSGSSDVAVLPRLAIRRRLHG